jgi:hypothetical protein
VLRVGGSRDDDLGRVHGLGQNTGNK